MRYTAIPAKTGIQKVQYRVDWMTAPICTEAGAAQA